MKGIYFFLVFVSSGLATSYYRNPEGVIALFIITLLVMIGYGIKPNKSLYVVIGIWLLYSLVAYLSYRVFTPYFIFRHIAYMTIAYTMIKLYKEELFIKFERYIFYFAAISLVFYIWQIASFGSLLSYARALDISGDMERSSDEYYNFLVFTVEISRQTASNRNYGFAFEPGVFSVFLSLGIYFNLLINKFKIKGNFSLLVMFAALITTFSTTGYLAFGAMLAYLILAEMKGIKKYTLGLIVISAMVYSFFTFDFLYDKINTAYESGKTADSELLSRSHKTGMAYSSGRFGGMLLGWKDLQNYPLIGTAGVTSLSLGRDFHTQVYIVSGIASIMSTYGLFGIIIFIFFLLKSSFLIAGFFNSRARFAFLIIMFITSFSYSTHIQVILFAMMFISFYIKESNVVNNINTAKASIRRR